METPLPLKMSSQAKYRKVGDTPISGSAVLGGVAGVLIAALIAGLIASSVILSNQINSVTYTNYTWDFDQSNPPVDWSHVVSTFNNATIVVRRTFSVSKFPTYQRLQLTLGGFLSSADNTMLFNITFKNVIEPPYTWPFYTGTFALPNSVIAGFSPGAVPITTNIIYVLFENGSGDVTLTYDGNGVYPSSMLFSPAYFFWTIYNNGTAVQ